MGKSDPDNDAIHKQQSMVLVPADTPGITIHRMLSVFGYDDAPHGHGQISFNNVRVPADHILLGEGRGFEIAQGRLGPGRIHHAMRSIGGAERALDFFIARINDPKKVAFGLPLHRNPVMLSRVAECRMQIDAARLVVLNAAIAIDDLGSAGARKEIAEAKVVVPKALLFTLDLALQAYGAEGVCQDTPLAQMWAHGRTMSSFPPRLSI
jgi:acyl-CoA dehydrogenase